MPWRVSKRRPPFTEIRGVFYEMKSYQFDSDIAQIYGVDDAIMIWNFTHWIEHNAANGMHFHDGRYWTYNTVDSLTKIFPFWSKGQIRRILNSLEKQNVIITGNFNTFAYVRTMWYAFTDSFQQMHLSKSTNGNVENEKSNSISNNSKNNTEQIINTYTADGGLFQQEPEKKVAKRPKRTSERTKCLFENSKFFEYEKFKAQFDAKEFENVDILYYYHAVADWSSQYGRKMKDWIATTRNFIRGDIERKKLHIIGSKQNESLEPDAIEYLEQMSEGL